VQKTILTGFQYDRDFRKKLFIPEGRIDAGFCKNCRLGAKKFNVDVQKTRPILPLPMILTVSSDPSMLSAGLLLL